MLGSASLCFKRSVLFWRFPPSVFLWSFRPSLVNHPHSQSHLSRFSSIVDYQSPPWRAAPTNLNALYCVNFLRVQPGPESVWLWYCQLLLLLLILLWIIITTMVLLLNCHPKKPSHPLSPPHNSGQRTKPSAHSPPPTLMEIAPSLLNWPFHWGQNRLFEVKLKIQFLWSTLRSDKQTLKHDTFKSIRFMSGSSRVRCKGVKFNLKTKCLSCFIFTNKQLKERAKYNNNRSSWVSK